MIGFLFVTAWSSSREIYSDVLALEEKISTKALACSIAAGINSAHYATGGMSRGAIQTRTELCSSARQTASAVALSFCE